MAGKEKSVNLLLPSQLCFLKGKGSEGHQHAHGKQRSAQPRTAALRIPRRGPQYNDFGTGYCLTPYFHLLSRESLTESLVYLPVVVSV